jgi:hypothetical protein
MSIASLPPHTCSRKQRIEHLGRFHQPRERLAFVGRQCAEVGADVHGGKARRHFLEPRRVRDVLFRRAHAEADRDRAGKQ